jgi:hypothetical protein
LKEVFKLQKIFEEEKRMLKEKTEIQRLIEDAIGIGRWSIEHFDEA